LSKIISQISPRISVYLRVILTQCNCEICGSNLLGDALRGYLHELLDAGEHSDGVGVQSLLHESAFV
jgi:hypothetical protein